MSNTTCPKCGYTRKDEELVPDYECPSCGIIYAKFKNHPQPQAPPQETVDSPQQRFAMNMTEVVEHRSKRLDEKYCADCGAIIKEKAEICPKCGVRQMPAPSHLGAPSSNDKSKIVAALLAFFLGMFGIHKFYLGQLGLGIVYLLFCWTGIPAIIGFIESIILLTMKDESFNRKYGTA